MKTNNRKKKVAKKERKIGTKESCPGNYGCYDGRVKFARALSSPRLVWYPGKKRLLLGTHTRIMTRMSRKRRRNIRKAITKEIVSLKWMLSGHGMVFFIFPRKENVIEVFFATSSCIAAWRISNSISLLYYVS